MLEKNESKREKNDYVLLKFHFLLTSSQDFNFPSLKLKFSDFSLAREQRRIPGRRFSPSEK